MTQSDGGSRRSVFGSMIPVPEHAALASIGARPLKIVMGSSVVSGLLDALVRQSRDSGGTHWLSPADTHNAARDNAVSRLRGEAHRCGADLVLGLELRVSRVAENTIEYVALGTAVAHDVPLEDRLRPIICSASAAQYVALRLSGYAPVGLAARSGMSYGRPGYSTSRLQRSHRRRFAEWPEFSQAAASARADVVKELAAQSRAMGADGLVGLSMSTEHRIVDGEGELGRHQSLMVVAHATATAVVRLELETVVQDQDAHLGALSQTRTEWRAQPVLPGLSLVQPLTDPPQVRQLSGERSDVPAPGTQDTLESTGPPDAR